MDKINIINIENNESISNKKDESKILNKKRKKKKNGNIITINYDKIFRRIIMCILNAIIRFINHKIKIDYNYDIGKGACIKQLLPINTKKYSHSKVDENKKILFKNLEEILATNISEKYSKYMSNHNIELVQYLINKGEDYKKIFELTFLDCIEYIRGTKNIDILDGLGKIDDILNSEKDIDEVDKGYLKYYIINYENIINKKKFKNNI